MFRSTKSWLVAVIPICLTLFLAAPTLAAPLPGIYWAALDDSTNNTGHFYYAPLTGSGIGTVEDIGVIGAGDMPSQQVTFMQVLDVGGTNYVYWGGCCGGTSDTYRAPLLGATPATLTIDFSSKVVIGPYQNRAFAVDANAAIPQIYASDSNASLDRKNADGSGGVTNVDSRAGEQYDAMHLYTNGANTHLLVGMRNQDGIYEYTYATGGVAGATEATILASTPGGGDLYDIAKNTSTGDLYFVDNYRDLYWYDGVTTTQILNGGANFSGETSNSLSIRRTGICITRTARPMEPSAGSFSALTPMTHQQPIRVRPPTNIPGPWRLSRPKPPTAYQSRPHSCWPDWAWWAWVSSLGRSGGRHLVEQVVSDA